MSTVQFLDECIRLGTQAKGRVATAQINNLLVVLNSIRDPEEAIRTTILWIARQMGRGDIDRHFGRDLIKLLHKVLKSEEEPQKRLDLARKILGWVKWAFESPARGVCRGLDALVQHV